MHGDGVKIWDYAQKIKSNNSINNNNLTYLQLQGIRVWLDQNLIFWLSTHESSMLAHGLNLISLLH
jgi:hypothetical protein